MNLAAGVGHLGCLKGPLERSSKIFAARDGRLGSLVGFTKKLPKFLNKSRENLSLRIFRSNRFPELNPHSTISGYTVDLCPSKGKKNLFHTKKRGRAIHFVCD